MLLWHPGGVVLSVCSPCDPLHRKTRSTQFKQPRRGSLTLSCSQRRCTHFTSFSYWDMIALLNSRIYFTHAGDLSKLYTFIAKEAKESEATFSACLSGQYGNPPCLPRRYLLLLSLVFCILFPFMPPQPSAYYQTH